MADRRPDDLSPPTAPFRPVPGQPGESNPFQGRLTEEHRPIHERINAAYASSAPVLPDDPDETDAPEDRADAGEPDRPSSAERFAAILAATTAGSREPVAPEEEPEPEPVRAAPQPAAAASAGKSKRVKAVSSAPSRRVRRARLRLTHIDPWSVMKTSFLLAVALGIVMVVAVAVVWSVLGAAGVWSAINSAVGDILGDTGSEFRVEDYLGMGRVMGFTMLVAVFDVVLITVIATLGAFLYNLAAALLGGVEVMLAEDER